MTLDEKRGYLYLPIEAATGDYYGGHRPGNNLFSRRSCASTRGRARGCGTSRSSITTSGTTTIRGADPADVTVDGWPRQSRRAAHEAGVCVRVRSRDRRADVADRRAAGAGVRRAGRVDRADAADPDQARGIRSPRRDQGRSDRLHAGDASRSAQGRAEICGWARRCSRRRRWSTRPTARTARWCCPAISAAANWEGGAFDPETGMLYVGSWTNAERVCADARTAAIGHGLRRRRRRRRPRARLAADQAALCAHHGDRSEHRRARVDGAERRHAARRSRTIPRSRA